MLNSQRHRVCSRSRVVGCTLTVRADRSRVYVASSTARTSGKDFTAWAHAPRKIHADPATRIRFPLVDGTEDASTACFAACQFNKTGFARFWLALERSILGPSRVQRGPIAALNWLRQVAVTSRRSETLLPTRRLDPRVSYRPRGSAKRAVAQRLLRRRTHRNNLSGKPGDFGRATSSKRRRLPYLFFFRLVSN